MKRLSILTLIFALAIGAVMAQDDDTENDRRHHPPRHRHPIHRTIIESLVDDTGLEPADVREALSDHETTFAELIIANGGDVDMSIADAITAATGGIERALEDERITQERADEVLEQLPEQVTELVNNPRPEKEDRPRRDHQSDEAPAGETDTSEDA